MGIGKWVASFGADVLREAWQAGSGQQAHTKRKATARAEKKKAERTPQPSRPARRSLPPAWYRQPATSKQVAAIKARDPNATIPDNLSLGAASDWLAQLGAKPLTVRQQVTPERRDRTATDLAGLRAKRTGHRDVGAGGGGGTVIEEYRRVRAAQEAEQRKPRHLQDPARIAALRGQAARLEVDRKRLWEQSRRDADAALQAAHGEKLGSRTYWEHLRLADQYLWQAEVLSRKNLYRD